ncbi:Ubiquitin-conjugating enzyme E2 15 [Tulasnella sp. 408]|nr:Ubiquitin-conjugating enzyme E2 15 [Tulasnella sp. 408]
MSKPTDKNLILQRQLRGLVDDDNLLEWEIMIIGPENTLYEGGFFKARLTFPSEYPLLPPKMRFITPMWHPNIYPDGVVCISILHPPGEDQWGYEQASERWLPVHTVETITTLTLKAQQMLMLRSVIYT